MESLYLEPEIIIGPLAIRKGPFRFVLNFLKQLFQFLGLWERGIKNMLQYKIVHHLVKSHKIPKELSGLKILHLSDLHMESIPDQGSRLREILQTIDADLCVITGDFRYEHFGSHSETLKTLEELLVGMGHFSQGVYAALGNHDCLAMVPELEALGVKVLVNEFGFLDKGSHCICIAAIDDPHYYRGREYVQSLFEKIPDQQETFVIVLAHSPDAATQCADAGADLYLSGHSHGGQICLPGGYPVSGNLYCTRKYFRGAWSEGNMKGYTSGGIGASGLKVRYFSPPEITIHHLIHEG